MSRQHSLRRAGPSYDPANPPEGTRLWLGVVASRLGVTITQMAAASEISRTAIADLLTNRWPVKTPQDGIRTALLGLMEARGATDEELAKLFHAHGRATEANPPRGADSRAPQPYKPAAAGLQPEDTDMLPLKAVLTPQARRHFKLFSNPFDGPVGSDDQMFRGAEFAYVREAAWQAAQTSGFVAIVGESGAGKTTVLEDLENRLEAEGQRIVLFKPSVVGMEQNDTKGKTLKSADVLHAILAHLAPDQPVPQTVQARTLRVKKLLAASASMGNTHMLVVEEAHSMPDATMKHLKRLHELREGRRNLLGILLLAQPELKGRLLGGMMDGSLREVAQRCEVVELLPLDGDIKPYLQTRAAAANVDLAKLITDDGIEQLRARLTIKEGSRLVSLAYPLAVNNLLIRALNAAAAIGAPTVTRDLVASA
jgi:type II secretory pathway predicted ATPase ExeA